MQLTNRMDLLVSLQTYMLGHDTQWQAAKERAFLQNGWFIPQFIDLSVQNIATYLLTRTNLQRWVDKYNIPALPATKKTIGLIMPGNIPLAGFYNFLCAFLSGHKQRIKLSSADDVLLKHLVQQLITWDKDAGEYISFEEMLKGCDAYLVAGTKETEPLQRYFSKYPGIIQPRGSAAAILQGQETRQQLELLADDVFQYFGKGCLNVTKLYVPRQYDFIPLLKVFERYGYLIDNNKYKNNYDYQLALLILNKEFYMTNGCILLTESAAPTSTVARLHYEYYSHKQQIFNSLSHTGASISLVGAHHNPFGRAQQSVVCEQDGTDTLKFLRTL